MTGGRVGNWVLGAELGRGPHGIVYRATALDDGRSAVVKVLSEAGRPIDYLQKFPAEMLFLQRLNHPNVARFYDSGVASGVAYYGAEFVEGQDLATAIRNRARKSDEPGLNWTDDLLRIAVQLARGLKHGHHRSILHRGLKPSNVLLGTDGTVKLTDFGVAKVLGTPPLSLTADSWGTAGYLAPEHFTGKPYTKRSDLYALGGVLYTIVTGRPPFSAASAAEFMHKHCYTLPERPANFVPKLPGEIDDLICGLLAKDPSRRPASAVAVLEELDRIRGKLERKGATIAWPPDPGDTGLMAALDEAIAEDEGEDDTPPRPLMSRPIVVVPAFLFVIALILAGIFWPRPGPDELWTAAKPLLQSNNPADWDRAWNEYLEPLGRRYPESYRDEIAAATRQINARRELKRAIETGSKTQYASEAERWYFRGLALAKSGERAEARRIWTDTVTAFTGIDAESRWVGLAEEGLEELGPVTSQTSAKPALGPAIERVRKLKASGKTAEADAIRKSLAELYQDDPEALTAIRTLE